MKYIEFHKRGDKVIDYALIGKRIREKRIEKKITQEQLAEQLEISSEYISRIENGRVKINLTRLDQISQILNVGIEYLISGAVVSDNQDIMISQMIDDCLPGQKSIIANIIREMNKR